MTLICNARAGRGAVARNLPAVIEKLEERGLDYEVQHTDHPGHATELARKAVQ
jgi:diacylglycerol kinase family enzyme